MMATSAFLGSVGRLTIAAALLVFQAQLGRAADAPDSREVRGIVQDESGQHPPSLQVLCWAKGSDRSSQWGTSDAKGAFVLPAPSDAQSLSCWISESATHEKYNNDSAIDAQGKMVLLLSLKTISTLGGVITTPRGKRVPYALVEVIDATGARSSAQADDNGAFELTNLKAGKAREVKYTAEGYYDAKNPNLDLSQRANLSTVLKPRPTAIGLLLLFPGIVVLAWWAYIDARRGSSLVAEPVPPTSPADEPPAPDPNAWLLIASLVIWGLVFATILLWMKLNGIESLTFFDTNLSFSLFVPVCGFLGALVFVIDLVQQKRPTINTYRELAMRLVLAPYVAIIIVIFFGGTFTFIQLTNLQSQAALAFFSGFLVVLFLQGLTERGNEILAQWRSTNRYEPSEIALKFGLDMEEDLKLRKANLKHLTQLQALPEADLRVLGRQTDLGEGFLVALQSRLSPEHVQAQLGPETWGKLHQEGLRTVWDVALLTPEGIEQTAKNQQIDRDVLTRFHEKCQAFVKA